MVIVFVSNYFNHHQAPFAEEMDFLSEHSFYFIETKPIDKERKKIGWGLASLPPYVMQAYGDKKMHKQCQRLIDEADVVIWGSCPMSMIRPRLRQGKMTFAYSERLFKRGTSGFAYWGRVLKYYCKLRAYQKNHYLLCASAYAAEDYGKIGLFKGNSYRWGYFPEVRHYDDIERILAAKKENSLLWVGRLISWKHPELAIELAKRLVKENVEFCLKIIGCGPMEEELRKAIQEYRLEKYVLLLGAMTPEEVRCHMEESQIYLFTSDQNEGWGAVLNEAMNSACAVVANDQIGAVPYLVQDQYNGSVYCDGKVDDLYTRVKELLSNKNLQMSMGKNAYHSLENVWNAKIAAQRLLAFSETRIQNYLEGPMSKEGI